MTKKRTMALAVLLLAPAYVIGARGEVRARRDVGETGQRKDLLVFAATSLREVFEDLAPDFEAVHPGTKVRLNLAGSQELRTQIEHGAKADVFASADLEHVRRLETQTLVGHPRVFARNEPVIVVPRGNPAGIAALTDLPQTRRLVVGAPEVPIGRYTLKIFEAAAKKYGGGWRTRLEASIVSRELNVRQVLAKVTLGEADAGIVYLTDARTARDKVEIMVIPAAVNVMAEYAIAVVSAAPEPALARAWVAWVLSSQGQQRLAQAGFTPGKAPIPPPAARQAPVQAPAR